MTHIKVNNYIDKLRIFLNNMNYNLYHKKIRFMLLLIYFIKLYLFRFYYGFIKNRYSKDVILFKKDVNLTRISIVNHFINNHKNKNFLKYLEIGCANNKLFNKVNLNKKQKFGIDPFQGGNIRKTSDDFFRNNKFFFDIIFIDGDHRYSQVQNDIINSIRCLKKNGIILIHDCTPANWESEHVPRFTEGWSGDVWKVAYELTASPNCFFRVIKCESGIGFLKIFDNFDYKKIDSLQKKRFKDYYNLYHKKIRFISFKELLNKIKI